uniref:Uncharacterized protein n=1 Tax=Glossina austeni TaxID=7395 RepID=A0A1A9UI09_GLOAU
MEIYTIARANEFRNQMAEEVSTSESKEQNVLNVYKTGELKNSAPNDNSSARMLRQSMLSNFGDSSIGLILLPFMNGVGVVNIDIAADKSPITVACLDGDVN